MNRPEANKYDTSVDEFAFEHYVDDLEKYCDELEWVNKKLTGKIFAMLGYDLINPCEGCEDYCYKNDECKSKGGCGNKSKETINNLKSYTLGIGEGVDNFEPLYDIDEQYRKLVDELEKQFKNE